jgi:DNA-binding response OmpR family regulator
LADNQDDQIDGSKAILLDNQSTKDVSLARILLVEDDEALSEITQEWLSFEGHLVEVADSGYDALEQINAKQYELIILDWNLPDMTGLELYTLSNVTNGKAKVIFLSGTNKETDRLNALEAGALAFIQKPFLLKELSNTIKSIVEGEAQ